MISPRRIFSSRTSREAEIFCLTAGCPLNRTGCLSRATVATSGIVNRSPEISIFWLVRLSSFIRLYDLVDRAEDRQPLFIQHFDAHPIAEAHIGGGCLPMLDQLDHLFFNETGGSSSAVFIRYRSRPYYGSCAQRACFCRVANQRGKIELHIGP